MRCFGKFQKFQSESLSSKAQQGSSEISGRKLSLNWPLKRNQLQRAGERIFVHKDAVLGKKANMRLAEPNYTT